MINQKIYSNSCFNHIKITPHCIVVQNLILTVRLSTIVFVASDGRFSKSVPSQGIGAQQDTHDHTPRQQTPY